MTAITPEVRDEIVRVYAQTRRSPFKTARLVGVSISDVFTVVNDDNDRADLASERYGGFGRPDVQPFIVARRTVKDRQWDNKLPEIIKARAEYEAGTHEMATGRDGQWLILYSIPRVKPVRGRKNYFQLECA